MPVVGKSFNRLTDMTRQNQYLAPAFDEFLGSKTLHEMQLNIGLDAYYRRSVIDSMFASLSSQTGTYSLTKSEFESLKEYQPITYLVEGVGTYYGGSLVNSTEVFSPQVGDLHVATSGNDSTGDGTETHPFRTLHKALTTTSSTGGITIWLAAGTYEENSGSGYLQLNAKAFTNRVTIRAKPREAVTVTHASGIYVMRFDGVCSNLTFQGIRLRGRPGLTAYVTNPGAGSISGFRFIECHFDDVGQSSTYSVLAGGTLGSTAIQAKRCTFESDGGFRFNIDKVTDFDFIGNRYVSHSTDTIYPLYCAFNCGGKINVNANEINAIKCASSSVCIMQAQELTVASTKFSVVGNIIRTAGTGIYLLGGASGNPIEIDVTRNTIEAGLSGIVVFTYVNAGKIVRNNASVSGPIGISCPTDTNRAGLCENVEVHSNQAFCKAASGHAMLIGIRGKSIKLHDNISDSSLGGTYGIVVKGDGHEITRNKFRGGISNSIYLKGATNCRIYDNAIEQDVTGGKAIDFAVDTDTSTSTANNSVEDNSVTVKRGALYGFGGAAIGAGNVVDRNIYDIRGSGSWGTLFGDTVTSLSEVQAAWEAHYSEDENDANSVVL